LTRGLIDALTELVLAMDYENSGEFADYVAWRIVK
jgi:hypothetical protein